MLLREFDIINKYFKPLASNCDVAMNLQDDVAKISLKKNQQLVVSKDLMIEDVHFLLDKKDKNNGRNIAEKLLRSNLSDLAASGARPLYYMLGFSKNNNIDEKFIASFAQGLKRVQKEFTLDLIGGDTVSSRKLVFSVTIFGVIENDQMLSRSKARVGDIIFVSGTIGDSYIGLQNLLKKISLDKKSQQFFLKRHFMPTPPIRLAQELVRNKLSQCAVDISDGLFADLLHICDASKLQAEINFDKIPLSNQMKLLLKKYPKINIADLASAGEDYEIIFTANANNFSKIKAVARKLKIRISEIGVMKEAKNSQKKLRVLMQDKKEITITNYGYKH